MQNSNQVKYVQAGTGPMFWGPGDRVTFLVTGEQSGGACFIFEVMVPGGGPPPHFHHFEEESFYLLEGSLMIQADGRSYPASTGDFIHLSRGTVHSFARRGNRPLILLAVLSGEPCEQAK